MRLRSGGAGAVPAARQALRHNPKRSVAALAGICFAILFMFLQLGFLGSALHTATAVTSRFEADLVLVSPSYVHVTRAGTIPRARLFQAQADPLVERTRALWIRATNWRDAATRRRSTVVLLGIRPEEGIPLRFDELDDRQAAELRRPGTMFVDRLGQPRLGGLALGREAYLLDLRAEVIGQFELGMGFLGHGAAIVSDQTFFQIRPDFDASRVQVGLVELAPGVDPRRAAERLRTILPLDTRILTAEQLQQIQTRHWVQNTSLGNIFSMGTLLGFLVGLVVLNQVLSTDISNHLPAYATLKAIGYEDRWLYGLVVRQSLLYAALGLIPSVLVALATYSLARGATHLPIFMTPERALGVALLTFAMCTASGLLAALRLRRADPADLLSGVAP